MPSIQKITISNLRNLLSASLSPVPGINVLHGENGSGKTSVLEGIYLLGLARSFRTSQLRSVITRDQDKFTLFSRLDTGQGLGLSKQQTSSPLEVRIDGSSACSTSDLAQQLPLQLFNSDTFSILEGSPSHRRAFIDWGVFHVEHRFLAHWRSAQKALQQRNSLLKSQSDQRLLAPWTAEFIKHAEFIDGYRRSYLEQLEPIVSEVLSELFPDHRLFMRYERGWDEDKALAEVLDHYSQRDQRYGYTGNGPHRAELRIFLDGKDAGEMLSRGQQKLVVCALKLAQARLLKSIVGKSCIFLVDDLPSELDEPNRIRLCQQLVTLDCQVFLTCIEPSSLDNCWSQGHEVRLFHVKHGKIEH